MLKHIYIYTLLLTGTLLFSFGCSSSDSKSGDPATDEVATDTENATELRVLRTSTQYLANTAKLLQLNPSEIYEKSGFDSLKSKLPGEAKVTEINMNDGGVVAASKVAASGCDIYTKKDTELSLSDFLDELTAQASFDPEYRSKLKGMALETIKGTSIEDPQDETEIQQAKMATCSFIVVITGLLF